MMKNMELPHTNLHPTNQFVRRSSWINGGDEKLYIPERLQNVWSTDASPTKKGKGSKKKKIHDYAKTVWAATHY
jgi:hypothetical protein